MDIILNQQLPLVELNKTYQQLQRCWQRDLDNKAKMFYTIK